MTCRVCNFSANDTGISACVRFVCEYSRKEMSHQKSKAQIEAEAEYQFAYTSKLQQTSYGAKLSPGTAKISQESVNNALIKFYQKMLEPVETAESLRLGHEYYVQADLKWRDFRVPALLKGALARPASIDDLVAMMVLSEQQLHQWAVKKNPTVTFTYPKEIKQIFCDTLREVVRQGEIDNPVSLSQSAGSSEKTEKKIKYRNILCCLLQCEYVHPFFRMKWVIEALLDAGCTLGSSSHNLCQFEQDHRWQLIHHFILSRELFISPDYVKDEVDGKEVTAADQGDSYKIIQLLLSHGCPSTSTSLSSERKVDCNASGENKWSSQVMNHLLTTYFFTSFKHQSKIDNDQVRADVYSKQYPAVKSFVKLFVNYGAYPFKKRDNHDNSKDDKTIASALFDEQTITTIMRDLTRPEPKYLNSRITAFCLLKFLLANGLDPDIQVSLPSANLGNKKQKLMRHVRTSPKLVALLMRYGGSISDVFNDSVDERHETASVYSDNEDLYNQGYLLGIEARELQLATIAKKQLSKLSKLSKLSSSSAGRV